ncbi:MAG: hypothetical protein LUH45_05775 [Clostridiales bacterium]|nr:hypothetical protein [Clostridiales bacterium]
MDEWHDDDIETFTLGSRTKQGSPRINGFKDDPTSDKEIVKKEGDSDRDSDDNQ